jgi:pimeloyl-ACP methyl ester carboxylesterase
VRRTIALLGAAIVLVLAPVPASAEPEHMRPQGPAKVAFGAGFPALVDHEGGFALGGFGGTSPGAARKHVPVIFVHGNNVDHADWYVVRDDFRAAGWSDQELYALSYNGLGGENGTATTRMQPERDAEHIAMGWDGNTRITNNTVNVPDLYDFIRAVQSYTGSPKFSLVTHSLGVTLARKVLKDHPELRPDLVAFVGIAGGNHGTAFCPPGSQDALVSCNEIAAGSAWLDALNGPNGNDETYGATKWLTIYDGSGAGDPAYAGTYRNSPRLAGAQNRAFPGTYHNDLRIDAEIVRQYRLFLEAAEAAVTGAPPQPVGYLLARTG